MRADSERVTGYVLTVIGLGALCAIMWMSWRFGYSLQDDAGDRVASAFSSIFVDAGAAALVFAAGLLLARGGWGYLGAPVALACSLVLIAYSVLSVFSFMATRVARLEAHNQLVALEQSNLEWQRNTVLKRNIPRSDKLYLRQETKGALEKLRREVSIIPDAPAKAIAGMVGTSTERVQQGIVIYAAAVNQFVKLVCLFFGGVMTRRARVAPVGGSRGSGGGSGGSQVGSTWEPAEPVGAGGVAPVAPGAIAGGSGWIPVKGRPSRSFTREEAMADLQRLCEERKLVPSHRYLAQRWRVRRQRASEWVRYFEQTKRTVETSKVANRVETRPVGRLGDGGARNALMKEVPA